MGNNSARASLTSSQQGGHSQRRRWITVSWHGVQELSLSLWPDCSHSMLQSLQVEAGFTFRYSLCKDILTHPCACGVALTFGLQSAVDYALGSLLSRISS